MEFQHAGSEPEIIRNRTFDFTGVICCFRTPQKVPWALNKSNGVLYLGHFPWRAVVEVCLFLLCPLTGEMAPPGNPGILEFWDSGILESWNHGILEF